MSKYREQVEKIIEAAEKAAYQRGWDECAAAINTAAIRAKSPEVSEKKPPAAASKRPGGLKRRVPAKKKAGGRIQRGSAEGIVLALITEHPGYRGTSIAETLAGQVNKHTIRTVLRRAHKNGKIEQDQIGGWHLKGHARKQAA